jgi:hypothetical protein
VGLIGMVDVTLLGQFVEDGNRPPREKVVAEILGEARGRIRGLTTPALAAAFQVRDRAAAEAYFI